MMQHSFRCCYIITVLLVAACSDYEIRTGEPTPVAPPGDFVPGDTARAERPRIALQLRYSEQPRCPGSPGEVTVTVSNEGDAALDVTALELTGVDWAFVRYTGLPWTLGPGGTEDVVLTGVDDVGQLVVWSNDPDRRGAAVELPPAPADAPPSVQILAPADGSSVSALQVLEIRGMVSDDATAAQDLAVTWLSNVDGVLSTAPADSGGEASYTWEGSERSVGAHVVTLAAIDACAQAASADVTINLDGVVPGCDGEVLVPLTPGNLLFPNAGLGCLFELDPGTLAVVQGIRLPAPYNYGGSPMLYTALVREDHDIVVNARSGATEAYALAIDEGGSLLAAEKVDEQFLQQIIFDPLDPSGDTVIGGAPFSSDVDAVAPYGGTHSAWLSVHDTNFIGIALAADGTVLAGSSGDGVWSVDPDGTSLGELLDITATTGHGEINGMTVDDEGRIYVAQNSYDHVAVFDAAGALEGYLTAASFNMPVNVFFNPDDQLLYVGNKVDGVLTILDKSGAVVGVVDFGGAHVGEAGLIP